MLKINQLNGFGKKRPSAGGAAIALVASVVTIGTGSNVTTASRNTVGANLIVVGLAYATGVANTLSDNQGNTWTPLTTYSNVGIGLTTKLFYCLSPTTNASHTFTATGSSTFGSIGMLAFSNAGIFDVQNGTTGFNSANNVQIGSIAPSLNDSVIVSIIGHNGTGTITVNSGYTILAGANGGPGYSMAMAHKIQTTAGAENPTFTFPGTRSGVGASAVFKHQ